MNMKDFLTNTNWQMSMNFSVVQLFDILFFRHLLVLLYIFIKLFEITFQDPPTLLDLN